MSRLHVPVSWLGGLLVQGTRNSGLLTLRILPYQRGLLIDVSQEALLHYSAFEATEE